MEMLNLDAMPTDELYQFAHSTGGRQPRTRARQLFGRADSGRTAAVRELHHYAWNMITARICRERGDIQTALRYEDIADRIYQDLPAFAKW